MLSVSDYIVPGSTLSVIFNHSSQNNRNPSLNNTSIICSQVMWRRRQRNAKPSGLQAGFSYFSCLFPLHAQAVILLSPCSSIAGLWHVATRKVQDAIPAQGHTGTRLRHCTPEQSHIWGGGLYPPGLCFREGKYTILIKPLVGVSSLSTKLLNRPIMGRWSSYACHMPQNLLDYISLSEETLKLVLAIATVLQIQ